jgi:hypothetical protein
MPNYANTVMYKICCKNIDITDIYVGHTTNINDRINNHKKNCNNPKNNCYHSKVYEFIRNNGGFDNWEIIVLEEYPCNIFSDAVIKERELYEKLKPTLNSNYPQQTDEEYKEYKKKYAKQYGKKKVICECGYESSKQHLKRHQKTDKHIQLLSFKDQPCTSSCCFSDI